VARLLDQGPLRVKRVGFVMSAICPVYPKQQTFPEPVGTSHLCEMEASVHGHRSRRHFEDLRHAAFLRYPFSNVTKLFTVIDLAIMAELSKLPKRS
jgi:hypothetical protein